MFTEYQLYDFFSTLKSNVDFMGGFELTPAMLDDLNPHSGDYYRDSTRVAEYTAVQPTIEGEVLHGDPDVFVNVDPINRGAYIIITGTCGYLSYEDYVDSYMDEEVSEDEYERLLDKDLKSLKKELLEPYAREITRCFGRRGSESKLGSFTVEQCSVNTNVELVDDYTGRYAEFAIVVELRTNR